VTKGCSLTWCAVLMIVCTTTMLLAEGGERIGWAALLGSGLALGLLACIAGPRVCAKPSAEVPAGAVLAAGGFRPVEDRQTPQTYENIAFAESPPTWRGWKRRVGKLTISAEALELASDKGSLRLDAPFHARRVKRQCQYWPIIEVEGKAGRSALLVLRGAPRTVFGADMNEMVEETDELVHVNNEFGGTPDTKVCPCCAEIIQHAAVKCKHCRSTLE
jgi:hypothetical protein